MPLSNEPPLGPTLIQLAVREYLFSSTKPGPGLTLVYGYPKVTLFINDGTLADALRALAAYRDWYDARFEVMKWDYTVIWIEYVTLDDDRWDDELQELLSSAQVKVIGYNFGPDEEGHTPANSNST